METHEGEAAPQRLRSDLSDGVLRLGALAWATPALGQAETQPTGEGDRVRRRDRRREAPQAPEAPSKPADTRADAPQESAPPSGSLAEPSPPQHFEPVKSRWYRNFPAYEINEPGNGLDPYRQNPLKGDYPILGEDVFLALTFTDRVSFESRRIPTPTGGSGQGGAGFFGEGEQLLLQNLAVFSADLFQGQQAFKPVDWRIRASLAYNTSYLEVEEVGVVNVDVGRGRTRYSDYLALQEALLEVHLVDLSDRYDFLAAEAGILPFRSDFRGFIFDDTNLGVRLLGNADENKWQYSLAAFQLLEKDTNSELNRLEGRDQAVLIANVFRQDWPFLGYTTSLSFHYNHDDDSRHFDRNGFLVRPAPVGLARPHVIEAFYAGWAGEGHLGPVNVTHAYYHAFGRDSDNPFAGRGVDINALLGAVELSYDFNWLRVRAFGLYASGDDDPRDGEGKGFDTIVDAPNFAGGAASFFNRQAIRLLGVNLTQRHSFLADLSSSKTEGQANFVNPGVMLVGGAMDFELTPTWRAQVGSSYLLFAETDTLETYLQVEDVDREIGVEVFASTQYRPLLTNNVLVTLGAAPFFPGQGFQKIYQSSEVLFSTFLEVTLTW